MKKSLFRAALFALALVLGGSVALEAAEPVVARRTVAFDAPENLKLATPTSGPGKYQSGYELEGDVYKCSSPDSDGSCGVSFGYKLDQETPKPIVAFCSSKGENVSENMDSGYSLYLDVVFADGTPLWGQTHQFPVGDSDWSRGKVAIIPSKPIKSVSLYALFRNHSGTAYFKDVALYEYASENEIRYFDGAVAENADALAPEPRVMFRDQSVDDAPFLAVSAVAPTTVANFGKVSVVKETRRLDSGVDEIALNLRNTSEDDAVFTLYYSLPIPEARPGEEWVWFDGPRKYRPLGAEERSMTRDFPRVGSGKLSRYPLGVVARRAEKNDASSWGEAFGIALDPDYPAFFRVAANGATRELYVAYDLALTKEKPSVELKLAILCWRNPILGSNEIDPTSYAKHSFAPESNTPFGSTPFRAAFDVWRRSYPEAVRVRALNQGNWTPFAKISALPNYEDFGFAFKEGDDEIAEDDARGITTFRYTEPMTWWQSISDADASARTLESALEIVKKLALRKDAEGKPSWTELQAAALLTTGMRDATGRFAGEILDTPWCDGVVWSVNDAPGLVALVKSGKLGVADAEGVAPRAGFENKWSEELANEEFGEPLNPAFLPRTREATLQYQTLPGLDGEYVDSSEGYVTAELDFTREYFEGMATPLVFSAADRRPAIFRGLVAYEYVRKISEDVHARGRLIMANATPGSHFWLAPRLDVLGTETNWNWGGSWRPMPDEELMYRRVLCCGKPYCFLMNTDFDKFPKELSERYMKRAVAYGMFPSFFSADASTKQYYQNPELYERDRPLFKRYLPVVKKVAEAGWEPEPGVRTNDELLYAERFGAIPGSRVASNPLREGDAIFLTLFNDSDETKTYELALSPELADFVRDRDATVTEEFSGETIPLEMGAFIKGSIESQDVKVFKLDPKP